jgi:hypothetical protein
MFPNDGDRFDHRVWNHPDSLIDAAEKEMARVEKKRLKAAAEDSERTETDEETFKSGGEGSGSDEDGKKRRGGIKCGKCKSNKVSSINQICVCNKCRLALHQHCHFPPIEDDKVGKLKWTCQW